MKDRQNPELDFDPDELRKKYERERDKRVRKGGEDQYHQSSGEFAHFADSDPYASSQVERQPVAQDLTVAIIGGGWGGLLSAARLREAGINDFRIIEDGSDFGGTWYWNRYPGAQCDIESYCYMPLLEETGYMPKEKFSFAPEIFEHAQRIGRRFDLYPLTLFQTRVTDLRWDDSARRWIVSTNRGDSLRARHVVLATGPANRSKLPGIPGIHEFAGHTFHTNRWDYAYTGGDHNGGLHKLRDKRVAIIGTGATAIQCVPFLASDAKHLYVLQRTPSSVDLRRNKPTDPEWAKTLKPGWQQARQQNFDDVFLGRPYETDLVEDGWTDIAVALRRDIPEGAAPDEIERLAEIADFRKMNQVRARVDEIVTDRATAEKLKPWYRQMCKRPTFNDDYLPAFNRPNVTLIDTSDSQGVERITQTGFIANGQHYEVDCIIFATGFETGTAFSRRIGFPIQGVGGRSLYDHWSESMRTLHGLASHGFPNWFYIGPSQVGATMNYAFIADSQASQLAYIISEAEKRGLTRVEPTAEAEAEWVATIRRLAVDNAKFLNSCTPGYFNNEGEFGTRPSLYEFYAPGTGAFRELLAAWRADGRFEGMKTA